MRRRSARFWISSIRNRPIPLLHRDPFTLLVAVLLSAQTTDAQVNRVTPGLFVRAATPQAMARLSADEILESIRACGLAPTKAKNVKKLAETLLSEHGGEVPRDMEALERLPGVGHKTASVVMSQAFGEPAFAVDTHIHRLAHRWKLSNGKSVEQTERDLKKVFPTRRVVPPPSPDDLFRTRVLSGPGTRGECLSDLLVGCGEELKN